MQYEPDITLSTEHAACSYGLPVVVADGQAYGPGDVLPGGKLATEWVLLWASEPGRTPGERDDAARFLAQAGLSLESR